MEGQQQHAEDDSCVSRCTLFDILQAAPRLAELLPPQGCKALAASCKSLRTWHRVRVTVIRLTDSKDMALLQPQHWPCLVTVMLDSTSDHCVSEVDTIDVRQSLPTTWTQHATVCLGANRHHGEASMCDSLPINTIAVLVQPAGLHMLQQQDKRPHMCTLRNLVRRAAPYATDMFVAGDLSAPILAMFAQHRWLCLKRVTMYGPGTIDADVVSRLGQFVPQSVFTLHCAYCCLTPEACSSLSDIKWPGLHTLNLTDCSLDTAAMRCLSKAVWSNLGLLDLSGSLLGVLAVKHLVSARLLSLKLLKLCETGLNAAALDTLSTGNWPRLSWLYLQGNHIDIQGMQSLMQGVWHELQYLGLTHHMLDEGVYALLEVRDWQHLCGVVSDVQSPHRHSYAPENDISLSRSTGTTWSSLNTVAVSFTD